MGSREYSAPRLGAALALCAAASLGACDSIAPGEGPEVGDSPDVTLSPPPFLLQSRVFDPARLSVSATVSGIPTLTEQRNGIWYTSFTLTEDNTGQNPLVVTWSYEVPGGPGPIAVARSPPTTVSLSLETRDIRIGSYDTNIDDDNDGATNLEELERGTWPFPTPLFAPRAGQGDCRETRFPDQTITADQDALRDEIALFAEPLTDTFSLAFDRERHVYFATFLLEGPGTLVIDHQQGVPVNTNAILYDRRIDAGGNAGTADVSVAANETDTSDGVRARISATLPDAGLYCFALFDEEADPLGSGTPLGDVVLRIDFTPGT